MREGNESRQLWIVRSLVTLVPSKLPFLWLGSIGYSAETPLHSCHEYAVVLPTNDRSQPRLNFFTWVAGPVSLESVDELLKPPDGRRQHDFRLFH